RFRAARRVGWPPVRWARRLRPDPLSRLGIGQGRDAEGLERTSLPEPDAAARARASGGVRRFADAASAGGSDPWRAAVRGAARSREERLPDALDQAVAGADLRARTTSWWWPVLDVLQWLTLLTWVVGLGWLALNALLAFLGMPPPPMPMVEGLWAVDPDPAAHRHAGAGHRRRGPARPGRRGDRRRRRSVAPRPGPSGADRRGACRGGGARRHARRLGARPRARCCEGSRTRAGLRMRDGSVEWLVDRGVGPARVPCSLRGPRTPDPLHHPAGASLQNRGTYGFCRQEASQAHVQEEAPQAASQDPPPASQQEVTAE